QRRALLERVHTERRCVTRGAAGWQHVIRTCEVITGCFGRPLADEDRTGGRAARRDGARLLALELEVLGRELVRKADRLVDRANYHRCAVVRDRVLGDLAARQARELRG